MPTCLRSAIFLLALASFAAAAQEVTIYRCIDAKGNLTLRDSPCEKGQKQDVRAMQRPKDPAPGSAVTAKPAPPATPAPPIREVQVIYRNPPRPMYDCTTPDGQRYTSDDGDGNPRSVPIWTLGYSPWPRSGDRPRSLLPSDDRPGLPPGPHAGGYGGVPYTWIRDECHVLPQDEVCSRLSDRRYEIIRRYNVASPTEQNRLDAEQRRIDARIAEGCGNP